jgi:hypothetical protein
MPEILQKVEQTPKTDREHSISAIKKLAALAWDTSDGGADTHSARRITRCTVDLIDWCLREAGRCGLRCTPRTTTKAIGRVAEVKQEPPKVRIGCGG